MSLLINDLSSPWFMAPSARSLTLAGHGISAGPLGLAGTAMLVAPRSARAA